MTEHLAKPFERFYEESKDRVYRALLVSGRQPAKAEDAVAEAFARAWEKWESVGQFANPTGWVVRTAMNCYNSDWRKWHREVTEPPPIEIVEGPSGDDEIIGLVWKLPKRQRQVVALRILADLSEEESGRLLGISPKTVSVHLHRALDTLRRTQDKHQEGGDPWTIPTSLDA